MNQCITCSFKKRNKIRVANFPLIVFISSVKLNNLWKKMFLILLSNDMFYQTGKRFVAPSHRRVFGHLIPIPDHVHVPLLPVWSMELVSTLLTGHSCTIPCMCHCYRWISRAWCNPLYFTVRSEHPLLLQEEAIPAFAWLNDGNTKSECLGRG